MRDPALRERRDLPRVRAKARRIVRRTDRIRRSLLLDNPRVSYMILFSAAMIQLATGMLVIPSIIMVLGVLHLMASEFLQRLFGERPMVDVVPQPAPQTATRVADVPVATTPAPALPPPGPAAGGFDFEDERIPSVVRPKVQEVVAMVNAIEARARADEMTGNSILEIRRLRDNHLPTLLRSYAAIPPEHRTEIYRKTGKSASYALGEAVDRMRKQVETISKSMAEGDINMFMDNLRFVQENYDSTKDPFDLKA